MLVYNEPWTSDEATMMKNLIGRTVDESRELYPDYIFNPASERGDEEIFYENLISFKTDANGKITHIAFG